MTPRLTRLWWLSGLAGAALTLNAQTPPAPPIEANSTPVAQPAALAVESPRLQVTHPNELISEWNTPSLPLALLIPKIEDLTERTVLRAQGLANTDFPILFKTPTTRAEALQAVETILNLNQIALIPLGTKFIKIVPLQSVRMESPTLIEGSTLDLPPSGQVAAKLFQLNFLRASEASSVISTIMNQNLGGYMQLDKANALLVTDSISNLQRIEVLLQKLDQPIPSGIATKFYTLTNGAKASDIVTQLGNFLRPLQAQIGTATSYNADDRTNQIILFSDARQFPLFDELIAKLDVKADPNTRNEVIPLKNAAAKDIASLLSTLIKGQTASAQAGNSVRPGQILRNPTPPTSPDSGPQPSTSGFVGEVGSPSNEFSSLVNIQPDERTNAIVVSGTVDDIRLIRSLVDKLDTILPQVRFELVVAEVVLSDQATSGISKLGLNVQGGKLVGFRTDAAGVGVGGAESTDPNNPGTLTGFATLAQNLDLTGIISIAATPRKNNSTVLSVPSITTMHNKEGTIFIGETRPVVSGIVSSASGAQSGQTTSSTVTQQEIGTKVSVKPLIGYDGTVQVEAKLEISSVTGRVTLDGNEQPIIGKRTSETFLTVRSGEIIVLGGIQSRSNGKNTNRLGPIPFLGDILGARTREENRTELVFFIRPTVLTNTPTDNEQAMRQIELMPNREAVKKILAPSGVINSDKKPAAENPALNRRK